MNYPLITEYIDAIRSAEHNFDKLTNLRAVLDGDGQPIMMSGNSSVVFKMEDVSNGKHYAVKCFLKEQENRAESYQLISDELSVLQSDFVVTIKYLNKELFVDSNNLSEEKLPVVLMNWVEGETLDKYIRNIIDDKYQLSLLAYQFSRLSMWLLAQPFAHGDLKPDNIIVREDGTLTLVDYDGMYVPAMKGQKARELGSPDFRHPSRTEDSFDEHIDDFSIASIMLSLKAIAVEPDLLEKFGAEDRLLLSEKDYIDINECQLINEITATEDSELRKLLGLFNIAIIEGNLSKVSYRLFSMSLPQKELFETEQLLIPFRKKDKWGFCNTKKQIVIEPQYDIVEPFSDGLAVVVLFGLDWKWGFIDKSGKQVIPLKYGMVEPFSEGLAKVFLDWSFGYIDETGEEVTPLKYDMVYLFSEGLAIVQLDGKYGFIDKTGEEVTPLKYDGVYLFSEGLAAVELDGKYGFIDETGKEVIPLKYDNAKSFSEGLAAVELDGKYGFIDKAEKVVITFKYDDAKSFSEGLAVVTLDWKQGYVDKTGKEVIPIKYDSTGGFSEGLAAVLLDGKWGYIDKTGKEVIPIKYDDAQSFSEGLAIVVLDGKWGYIDKSGKEVIPLKYDSVEPFSEGFAAVESDEKYGFVDKTGKEVIPLKYDSVEPFSEGFAAVESDEKYGFIDKAGKVVIPFKYDDAKSFSEGFAVVKLDGGEWSNIDKNGTEYFED